MAVNSLLPRRHAVDVESDPEVLDLDQAGDALDALSSETARAVLTALYESPSPVSEIAKQVDTSLQNVEYHLGRLEDAGLVEAADTWYSSRGREMDVYAPTSAPLVLFAGDPTQAAEMAAAIDDGAAEPAPDA